MKEVKLKDEEEEEVLSTDNIYDKEARVVLVEDGEITLKEAAFMEGYEDAELGHMEED